MTLSPTAPPQTTHVIADLFCGAGGTSHGAKLAIEGDGDTMELVAINHNPTAIATHQANHPEARHLIEDVNVVDPEEVVENGYLDILMASPECKHFSRARGGKPIHDQGRMAAWSILNWLTKLDVKTLIVENVPEFRYWGPLNPDGKPDRARRGDYFQSWYNAIAGLGYQVEFRNLNAADYGDATSRTRLFLLARKDGNPILWPEPSHAKHDPGMFPGRLPWRGAKEIIDWSLEGRSIIEDPKYLRKPLSEKTRRRIARGLTKYGGILAPIYIRLLDLPEDLPSGAADGQPQTIFLLNRNGENGSDRCHSVDDPMCTATGRGAGYKIDLALEQFMQANRNNNNPRSLDEPVPSLTSAHGGGTFLIDSSIEPFMLGQQSGATARSTDQPTPTIAQAGAVSLTNPTIIQYYGQSDAQDIETPLSTITGCKKHALIDATLIEYYGNSNAADIEAPLPTVTGKDRHALVESIVVQVNHGDPGEEQQDSRAAPITEPLRGVTTQRGLGLASADATPIHAEQTPIQLPRPFMIPNFGEADGQEPRCHSVDQPTPTVTGRGACNLILATMDEATAEHLRYQGIDPRRMIYIEGEPHLLDIRFRMLENRELARAMGFDDDETEYEFHGNKGQITKQIGNAVPVHLASALVKATINAGK